MNSFFRKSVEKIHVALQFDNNNDRITRRPMFIYDNMSLNSSSNENVSHKICSENQNIFYFPQFFLNSCPMQSCALYETMRKDTEREDRQYNKAHALCLLDI